MPERAVVGFPAHAPTRARALELLGEDDSAAAVPLQSDVRLALETLRLANAARACPPEGVIAIEPALALVRRQELERAIAALPTFDLLDDAPLDPRSPERFYVEATAMQRAAERVARALSYERTDELLVVALLVDIGKLTLPPAEWGDRRHATAGALAARRLGLPERLARAIENHHGDASDKLVAIVRLARMLASYQHRGPVELSRATRLATAVGLRRDQARSLIYELTYPPPSGTPSDGCPLSPREVEVLRSLSEGQTYKQIALQLGISASGVRGHLHRIYSRLGVVDRAQAVLMATRSGWI